MGEEHLSAPAFALHKVSELSSIVNGNSLEYLCKRSPYRLLSLKLKALSPYMTNAMKEATHTIQNYSQSIIQNLSCKA